MEIVREGMVAHVFGKGITRDSIVNYGFSHPIIVHIGKGDAGKNLKRELRELPVTFTDAPYRNTPRSERKTPYGGAVVRSQFDLLLRERLERANRFDPTEIDWILASVRGAVSKEGGRELLARQGARWKNVECGDVIAEFDEFCAGIGAVLGRTHGGVEKRIYEHLKRKYAEYKVSKEMVDRDGLGIGTERFGDPMQTWKDR